MKNFRAVEIVALILTTFCWPIYAGTAKDVVQPGRLKEWAIKAGDALKIYCDPAGEADSFSCAVEPVFQGESSSFVTVDIYSSTDKKGPWLWNDYFIAKNDWLANPVVETIRGNITSRDFAKIKDSIRKEAKGIFLKRNISLFEDPKKIYRFDIVCYLVPEKKVETFAFQINLVEGTGQAKSGGLNLEGDALKEYEEFVEKVKEESGGSGIPLEELLKSDENTLRDLSSSGRRIARYFQIALDLLSKNPDSPLYCEDGKTGDDKVLVRIKNLFYVKALANSAGFYLSCLEKAGFNRTKEARKAVGELKKFLDKLSLEKCVSDVKKIKNPPSDKVFKTIVERLTPIAEEINSVASAATTE